METPDPTRKSMVQQTTRIFLSVRKILGRASMEESAHVATIESLNISQTLFFSGFPFLCLMLIVSDSFQFSITNTLIF
jgi:hypothetical protein